MQEVEKGSFKKQLPVSTASRRLLLGHFRGPRKYPGLALLSDRDDGRRSALAQVSHRNCPPARVADRFGDGPPHVDREAAAAASVAIPVVFVATIAVFG